MKALPSFAILLTCLALAFCSLAATVSHLAVPGLTSIAFPDNGHVQIKKAVSLYKKSAVQSVGRQGKSMIGRNVLQLANDGVSREPFAATGYFLIAASADIKGDTEKALKIMRLASKLSTRDLLINSWLLEFSSKQNDRPTALEYTDRLVRVNRDLEQVLVTIMAQALEEEETIPLMSDKLRREPPWSGKFWWATLKAGDNAMKNTTRLRRMAHDKKLVVPSGYDQSFVSELIRRGHYDEANQMTAAIAPADNRKSTNLLRNGTFDQPEGLPPLGWNVRADMALGGFIDRTAGHLQLSATANSEGVLANQVLQIPEGFYQISAEFVPASSPQKGQVYISLSCVSGYGTALEWKTEPVGQKTMARFTPDKKCSLYNFAIVASETEGEGFDLTLSQVAIEPSATGS